MCKKARNQSALYYVVGVLAIAAVPGCVFDGLGSSDSNLNDRPEECITLNFDTRSDGTPIAPGTLIEDAYADIGVDIEVWTKKDKSQDGLGVAFDSDNPTGGDDDLKFNNLGNLLINQEHWDASDVAAGFVSEPDDHARGALFEFRFDEPVCVKSMVLLDIDFGEDPVEMNFYDETETLVATHFVNPMGSNVRLDVSLPAAGACNVRRMTAYISSSGAMDNLEFCKTIVEPDIWTHVFDGGGNEMGHGLTADTNADVTVAGTAFNGANYDGVVRKYDAFGLLWSATFDNGNDDESFGVASDSSDNLIAVGTSSNGTDTDLWVRKYDSAGNEMWTRIFDGGGNDGAHGVAVDSNDNIVVAGFTTLAGSSDILLRKYDSSGAVVWTRTAGPGVTDVGHAVAVDGNNNVVIAGSFDNGSDHDIWVAKYNSGGTQQWARVFDGGAEDALYGVATDSSNNVIGAGSVTVAGNTDVFVRKWDASGNTVWTVTEDFGSTDIGRGVATDALDNVIVGGEVQNATMDGWTRKYDSAGVELWTELFDRGAGDVANGVTTDLAGSVISAGSFDNGSDLDLWVAKYRP